MSEPVVAALKEADAVVKKQRTCHAKTSAAIDTLLAKLESARASLESSTPESMHSPKEIFAELAAEVKSSGVAKEISTVTKDFHKGISALGKAVDKAFESDICKASRDVKFDAAVLNQVIAEHLFREGRFSVGRKFAEEASVEGADELERKYEGMHDVLRHIAARDLGPAMQWAEMHSNKMNEAGSASNSTAFVAFEFKVHRLRFLQCLTQNGPQDALTYARAHFSKFQGSSMKDIQRLMAAIIWHRNLESSPYSDLLSPALWDDVAASFKQECCSLFGMSCESPLLVAVSAGSVALRQLLKMAEVLAKQDGKKSGSVWQDLKTCEQLPLELDLGREFVFHSIFACPVSRDQSTADNPPMMLPCGHVLCQQSISKIAKGRTRPFKCPYCPTETTPQNCRQLYLPPALDSVSPPAAVPAHNT